MKIEKINENQIRCILTKEELTSRQIKLSELAYGTAKARALFTDLMQQAAREFGFRAENTPLMIEAIPLGGESIALIVTKVDTPEELDTRFSSFSPSVQNEAASSEETALFSQSQAESSPFEHLMNALRGAASIPQDSADRRLPISGEMSSADKSSTPSASSAQNAVKGNSPETAARDEMAAFQDLIHKNRLFRFRSLRDVIRAAHHISEEYKGESILYLEDKSSQYHLLLKSDSREQADEMRHLFAFLTEYSEPEMFSIAREQHLSEHCRVLFRTNALAALAEL